MYKIAPSILSADFAKLGQEIEEVILAGADWIHFDVMDNHYVPNLSIGPLVCESIKPYTQSTPIDVHLMVEPVDSLIESFIQAGADYISFHPEASKHVHRSLKLIKDKGVKAGLALNPANSLDILSDIVLDQLDYILIMSVNPGFGGQSFIPKTIEKIQHVKKICEQYYAVTSRLIEIQVDGGIKSSNIRKIAQAGANIFVVGSAIFNQKDRHQAILSLRKELQNT
ncbi:MAG: ribulose-phosphate 3-epimerase [Neisseriaceae bacterium]|nr:MAG: ribulose-phosphate 3-epimerase [Neisseriaceae bacterium]